MAKVENGNKINEGLCMKCAKDLGIPVESMLGNVMDKFGTDVTFHKADDNHFSVSREVSMSPTFYAWMFQFGEKARIEGPDRLIDAYKKYLKSVLKSIK